MEQQMGRSGVRGDGSVLDDSAQLALLASVVEACDEAVVTKDLDGIITSWNRAAEKIYGYTADEIIGRPFLVLTEPDHQHAVATVVERAAQGGRVERFETVSRKKDGGSVAIALTESPVRDRDGKVIGTSSIAWDLSARKATDDRFRGFLEAAPDAIVIIDPSGEIVLINSQTEKLFGYTRSELLGKPVEIIVPRRFHDKHPAHRAGYFADPKFRGMGSNLELYGLRKDGTEFPVEISLSPLRTEDSMFVSSAIRDITERRRAEERAREMSQYARSLIEASLDPLVTISSQGKITDVNEATIKVTGVHREKLIGTDFSDYFTEPEKARAGYQEAFSKGSVTDYPLTIRHNDGQLTDVLYNASVYRDARGNVLGVFAAARNVTAQKRAEAEVAEQRTKELERLAELERFQRLTVGRELKMIELKKEIEELKKLVAR